MKKRIFAMLMALIMTISLVPVSVRADCNDCQNAPYVPGDMLGSHLRQCETCGNSFSGGSCTPDQNGFCQLCNALLNHVCNSDVLKNLGKFHQYECSLCGEPQSDKTGHKYSWVSLNAEQHTKRCVCGVEEAGKLAAHKDADTDGKCDYCKFTMTNHACTFEAGVTTNNDGTHKINCTCGEFVQINCADYSGDGKCDSCGYQKYAHKCDFMAGTTSNGDGSHNINCVCSRFVKFICEDKNADNQCDSCGYVMYTVPDTEHEHNYVTHTNNDGTHTTSCNCGNAVTVTCLDNNGDGKCDSCGYQKYIAPDTEHEHNYVTHTNNDGTHTTSCNCGNAVMVSCLDNDGDGKCDSCGYQKYIAPDIEHEHNYVPHSNNDGTHTSSCNCGDSIVITCLDNNGDNFCDSCGYQKYTHVCEGGAWTPNNDGTHTSKCSCGIVMDGPNACQTIDGKTCYMCGYVMYECEHKNMVTDVTKEPTCTEDGYQKSKCPDCGDTVEGKVTAKGHDFQNGKCTACGIADPDCKHPKGVEKYTPATCTDAGSHSFWCPECNFEKMDILPALDHMKLEKIDPATCTKEGVVHVVCRRCNELLLEKILPLRDHVKLDKSYPATCTEDGLEHVVCTACDALLLNKVIPAGHKMVDGKCIVCGEACNHTNGVEKETPATCTVAGSKIFKCDDCGYEAKEDLPLKDHTEVDKSYAATCSKKGLTYKVCGVCGKDLFKEEIATIPHNYVNGVCTGCGVASNPGCRHRWTRNETVKEATCTETGLQNVVCTSCGFITNTKTLSRVPHKNVTEILKPATCTEAGQQKETCTTCGQVNFKEIKQLSHSYMNGVCAGCGQSDPNKVTIDLQDIFFLQG